MREAIEKVIAGLNTRRLNCHIISNFDKADAYEDAIDMLKEVLNTETDHTRILTRNE